ncbi:MAG TPA: ABC transporter ATP-binding protein [Acholeplasmataceae bacterium]|nr:ABC transporter ATP-binding protein [Acholeplasmataceae bacterium]
MNAKTIIKNVLLKKTKYLLSIIFLMILTITLKISIPLIVYHVINNIILTNDLNQNRILFWVMMTLLCAFSILLFDMIRIKRTTVLGNEITASLVKSAHSNVLRSETLEVSKLNKDDIYNKIMTNSNLIGHKYFSKSVLLVLHHSIFFGGIIITIGIINPWFLLYNLIALPIYYFLSKQIKKFLIKKEENDKLYSDQLSKQLYKNIDDVKHIKLLNGVEKEEENLDKLLANVNKSYQKIISLENLDNKFLIDLTINILFATVIGFGTWMILDSGSTTLGDMVIYFLLTPILFSSFKTIMDTKILPRHYRKYFDELNEIIELRPENRAFTVRSLDEIYSFKFKDVYYDYGRDSDFFLKDINFELKKGEKLGILGLSKSGKSTITDLIAKIIRPRQGSITINNCDINRIDTYYLRDLIAIVPQKFRLTQETIVDNIIYPYRFDDYKYNDALNKCSLKPLIYSLPKKENTKIKNSTISESDLQRIALANAFYKDAKIFVFDEVTSKMDQDTEEEMMDSIYRLKNKIIIVISNRIYNLINCDKILILNNGKIVEYGKTSELLADRKSTFAKMLDESRSSIG